jgi:hypothetical protein
MKIQVSLSSTEIQFQSNWTYKDKKYMTVGGKKFPLRHNKQVALFLLKYSKSGKKATISDVDTDLKATVSLRDEDDVDDLIKDAGLTRFQAKKLREMTGF